MMVRPETYQHTKRERGKRILIHPNAPRCGYVVLLKWNPAAAPILLNIPGRGLLKVDDPQQFSLGALMKLENQLTGQPEQPNGPWDLKVPEWVDILRALGCEVEIETAGGGSETN